MRVLIVDDERRARERLARLLAAMPGIEISGAVTSGLVALEMIQQQRADAVFLDVQMPELTGFDVLSALPTTRRPLIVFVTAYDQYACQAFDVSAVDYLLKPVTADRLARAVARLRDRETEQGLARLATHLRRTRPLQRLVGRRQHELHVLSVETVEAFVAEQALVFAVTSSGRFRVDKTLRELVDVLDGERFVRVHKQCIVNLGKLRVVEPLGHGGATARLQSGGTMDISRRYAPVLRQKLGW